MFDEQVQRLLLCVNLGLTLLGIGSMNLLLARWGAAIRYAATGLTAAAGFGVAHAWIEPLPLLLLYAVATVGTVLVIQGFGTTAFQRLVVGTLHLIQKPPIRHAVMVVAGMAIILGAIADYEVASERIIQQATEELMLIHGVSGGVPLEDVHLYTDKGRPIRIALPVETRDEATIAAAEWNYLTSTKHISNVIQRGHGDDRSNCHGWVFSGGRYLIGGRDVPAILEDNGYQEVTEPRPGDLVVYRDDEGVVTHTGVVRYVTPGEPVLVESKWGNLGVYLHRVDDSPYGANCRYYRSTRSGHMLQAVPPAATPPPLAPAIGHAGRGQETTP